jgi:orotate phosphoribosyltransferase
MDKYDELKELIKKDGVKFGTFVLSSGKTSDFYVDLRKVTLNPKGALLIGSLVFDMIKNRKADAIGGMTFGADPIALTTAITALQAGKNLSAFIVRKEQKTHGTGNWIEGPVTKGQRAIVVEDVITTGASALKAIDRIKEQGLEIDMVVAVLDRMDGGKQAIEALGYKVISIFTKDDFIEEKGKG